MALTINFILVVPTVVISTSALISITSLLLLSYYLMYISYPVFLLLICIFFYIWSTILTHSKFSGFIQNTLQSFKSSQDVMKICFALVGRQLLLLKLHPKSGIVTENPYSV